MWFILIFIFFLAIGLTAVTTLPLVLILLLCITVLFKKFWTFPLAFLGGLFLDLVLVRPLGQASLFFIVFILMLFLYERKFEIQTVPFVVFASFFGSLGYLLVFNNSYVIEQAIVGSVLAVLLFKFLIRPAKRDQ